VDGDRLKRLGLVSLMAITTMNIWTGGPLLAVWIGSRFQPSSGLSMFAIAMVAVSLGIICFVLVRILARLDDLHGRMSGRPSSVRRHVPWLRSMRGERPHETAIAVGLSALEKILVLCVVLAVGAFEVWFFFYSSSPIDQRSGR
jgi:hypothetical protein